MVAIGGPVAVAVRLADEILFPAALVTDRADVVGVELLDALAGARLYGLAGPPDAGGLGLDAPTRMLVAEIIASGCLTTAFVWMQHHRAVVAVANAGSAALRDEWLGPLCRGERRSGVALGGLIGGTGAVHATRGPGGWRLDGVAPWVTGWGRIDVVCTAALDDDDRIVWSLVDARADETLEVKRLRLVAADASATVRVRFRGRVVPDDRVIGFEPAEGWASRDALGLRPNGSLALGVARRCCALLGPTPLDDELRRCRGALDEAGPDALPSARAAASELAWRSAGALAATTGSRALLIEEHAQRLAREAMFVLAFGSRPPIKAELGRLMWASAAT